MFDVFSRLYNIARSSSTANTLRQKLNLKHDSTDYFEFDKEDTSFYSEVKNENHGSSIPQQVIDDLAVFSLAPPGSLSQVKKIRNQEIKKYHSDKFIDDPERLKTSKEIMQIYNAAYSRLKEYYKKQ
jgi:hypothetical protein